MDIKSNIHCITYSDSQGNIKLQFKYDQEKDELVGYVVDEKNVEWMIIELKFQDDSVFLSGVTIEGREHLIPAFKRTSESSSISRLDRVMSFIHHIILYLEIDQIELEDMSDFNMDGINISARQLRILQGKKSIYEKYGYKKSDTTTMTEEQFSNLDLKYVIENCKHLSFVSQEEYDDLIHEVNLTLDDVNLIIKSVKDFTQHLLTNHKYKILETFISIIDSSNIHNNITGYLFQTLDYYCDDIKVYVESKIHVN